MNKWGILYAWAIIGVSKRIFHRRIHLTSDIFIMRGGGVNVFVCICMYVYVSIAQQIERATYHQ